MYRSRSRHVVGGFVSAKKLPPILLAVAVTSDMQDAIECNVCLVHSSVTRILATLSVTIV